MKRGDALYQTIRKNPEAVAQLIEDIARELMAEDGRKRPTKDDKQDAAEFVIYQLSDKINRMERKNRKALKIIRDGSGICYTTTGGIFYAGSH